MYFLYCRVFLRLSDQLRLLYCTHLETVGANQDGKEQEPCCCNKLPWYHQDRWHFRTSLKPKEDRRRKQRIRGNQVI